MESCSIRYLKYTSKDVGNWHIFYRGQQGPAPASCLAEDDGAPKADAKDDRLIKALITKIVVPYS